MTASANPSALSESASAQQTGYKEDTKRTADVEFEGFGKVG